MSATAEQTEQRRGFISQVDEEAKALDHLNDFLRDFAGFDACQLHYVHKAVEVAGLELSLPRG